MLFQAKRNTDKGNHKQSETENFGNKNMLIKITFSIYQIIDLIQKKIPKNG